MTNDIIIQKWYLQVFNSNLYNNDSFIDYKLFNTNINDWELLVGKLKKDYKLAVTNFDKQLLSDDFQIGQILEQDNRSDYFLEIYLKNITSRIYTNSIDIIEGDIHRSKIKNFEYFIEFIKFMDDICVLLSKKICFYNEMDEEEQIFTIHPNR